MTQREVINTSKIFYWGIMTKVEKKLQHDIKLMNQVKSLAIQYDCEMYSCKEFNDMERVYLSLKNLYNSI